MVFRDNSKEEAVLGEPIGRANHRLRKNVMFHLVQQTGMDNCFKCQKKIETSAELSIEHKIPWRHHSKELFWDLDNIAFSHIRCNTHHTPRSTHCRKGHEWTEENTRKNKKGDRECRTCDRARWHRVGAKKRRDRKILKLSDQGLSCREIALKVGVSHVAVHYVIRDGETGSRT